MSYTYDNIVEEARKAGVLEKFSQEDHTAAQKNPEYGMSLVGLLKDVNNATTEEQRLLATETANKLRKSYGVTGAAGGAVGNSFAGTSRLVAPEKTGALSTSAPTTYQAVLDDIVNQQEFSYDHEKDPTYRAYEKQYLREGNRARENTLAQVAAMTGGRPSSYAISAAQQAENNYAAALADMIPTLRQNALTEHKNEMAAKYDILSVLQQRQDNEENRKRLLVQDALNKYQVLGYATPDVAQILGIPEGKPFAGSVLVGNGQVVENGQTWYMVGDTKLTQSEIDEAIAKNMIVRDYDPATGKVTYTWVPGQEQEYINGSEKPEEAKIGNSISSVNGVNMYDVGGRKLTIDEINRYLVAGEIVGNFSPANNTIIYQWANRNNGAAGGSKLEQKAVYT